MSETVGKVRFDSMMARRGRTATLSRMSPSVSSSVLIMPRRSEEESLIHNVSQFDRWFTMDRQTLDDNSFPIPPRKGDRINDASVIYTINVVEEISDGPNVIGYKARTTGGQPAT